MRSRLLLVTILFHLGGVWAQQRPLETESPSTVEKGDLRLELGFEFYQGAVYPLSGLRGDLTRLGVLGLRLGVADNVEIQVLGSIQDFLNVEERFAAPNSDKLDFSGNSTSDVGDFTLATKIRINREGEKLPSFGFRFGVELPNASNESGLGNDTTDAFGEVLASKSFGKLGLRGALGLVILGDPLEANSQDDLLLYGAGVTWGALPYLHLVADLHGRAGPGGVGNEEQMRLRTGVQIVNGRNFWDVAGYWGLEGSDPDFGIVVGYSRAFSLF